MATLPLTSDKQAKSDVRIRSDATFGFLHSSRRITGMVILLGAIIFVGELVVMLLLMAFPVAIPIQEAFIDSAILVVIVSPALYMLYYRPIRKRVDALFATKQEIRALSQKLMQVAEEEQRKLSLDLHDEFGQTLSTMRMEVEALKLRLEKSQPELLENCSILNQHLGEMRSSIHSIASRLRPSALDDLGIQDALEGLVHDLQGQYPALHFSLEVRGLKRRPVAPLETCIYRICQEAITNIISHAQADNIDIHLTSSYPELILTIRDDGCGFQMQDKLSATRSREHLGIIGMRERATSLGGRFLISSQPEHGTIIRAVFPQQENLA